MSSNPDNQMESQNGSNNPYLASYAGARKSAQDRAGVKFPISRLAKFAKQGKYSERTGNGVPVFMAGVLEYLTYELLELASHKAQEDKKKTIMPRHLMLAIRSDAEFNKMFHKSDFHETGRMPQIIADKKDGKKKKAAAFEEDDDSEVDEINFEQLDDQD